MDWVLAMEAMILDTSSVILGMARVAMALLGIEVALSMIKGVFSEGQWKVMVNNMASHMIGAMVHCHA